MVTLNLGQTTASNLSDRVEAVTVPSKEMDSPMEQQETTWTNTKASQYWGYFNSVADLKSALLLKSVWTVGKGYEVEPADQIILDHLRGWGKDVFSDIIFSLDVSRRIYGDAYAEIIRAENGTIINLKPLNSASMQHVVNKQGQIIRFEQVSNVRNGTAKKFRPEDIFYLSNNRIGDQIHGISDIEALEKTILAEVENFEDMTKIMHRQARPMIMFKVGTDDPSKLSTFIEKMDKAVSKGENIYIPDDEKSVNYEVVQINISNIILEWRNDIRNKFYRTIGLPQIVPGAGGGSTESELKVIYLAFEQLVERDQRYLENQIWAQLKIKVDFIPPTSMSQDLQADTGKDGVTGGMSFQPADTIAGEGK